MEKWQPRDNLQGRKAGENSVACGILESRLPLRGKSSLAIAPKIQMLDNPLKKNSVQRGGVSSILAVLDEVPVRGLPLTVRDDGMSPSGISGALTMSPTSASGGRKRRRKRWNNLSFPSASAAGGRESWLFSGPFGSRAQRSLDMASNLEGMLQILLGPLLLRGTGPGRFPLGPRPLGFSGGHNFNLPALPVLKRTFVRLLHFLDGQSRDSGSRDSGRNVPRSDSGRKPRVPADLVSSEVRDEEALGVTIFCKKQQVVR